MKGSKVVYMNRETTEEEVTKYIRRVNPMITSFYKVHYLRNIEEQDLYEKKAFLFENEYMNLMSTEPSVCSPRIKIGDRTFESESCNEFKVFIMNEQPDIDKIEIPDDNTITGIVGAQGAVYFVDYKNTKVAVKKHSLFNLKEFESRFLIKKNIIISKTLDHKNIVKTIGWYEKKYEPCHISYCQVMEAGECDLDYYLKNNELDEILKRKLFKEVVDAVVYIHNQGYCHCDLKPKNIIIFNIDGILVAKICDFGCLAKAFRIGSDYSAYIPQGQTPGYCDYVAATKMESGVVSSRKFDVYSLGLIAYFLRHGKDPKKMEDIESQKEFYTNLLKKEQDPFWKGIFKNCLTEQSNRWNSVELQHFIEQYSEKN